MGPPGLMPQVIFCALLCTFTNTSMDLYLVTWNIVGEFEIFCFQETWLMENSKLSLDGCEFLRSDRGKHKIENTG